ncbi:MAG: GNAT family N-acetyltransferase [Chitinophagaceae bacterium]|nr:GNAT family N-acetyltransferase [Chitinophagaceae bacterium]
MISAEINYKIQSADEKDVFTHLKKCKENFVPALDKTVNIADYSKKIVENSVTFEAWVNNDLAGLIAAYFNDPKNVAGYITNVSVLHDQAGKGLASRLLKNCISYAAENNFKEISLEVFYKNEKAIGLYQKNGFIETEQKNDLIIMKKYL